MVFPGDGMSTSNELNMSCLKGLVRFLYAEHRLFKGAFWGSSGAFLGTADNQNCCVEWSKSAENHEALRVSQRGCGFSVKRVYFD